MGILSTAAANAIKRAIEKALPDRCAIARVARTQDDLGGYTESEATYASGIPCRVDEAGLNPRERPVGGRESAVAQYNVLLSTHPSRWPGGAVDVLPTDVLVVTGEGAGRFEIVSTGQVTDDLARTIPANRIQ